MAQFCLPRDFPSCQGRYTGGVGQCKRDLEACFTSKYGPPVSIAAPGGAGGRSAVIRPQSASFQANLRDPTFRANLLQTIQSVKANLPRELFPGAILGANILASVGVGAAGLPAVVSATLTTAETLARSNMALNLSGILGAAGGILSGVNTSGFGNISQILGGSLQVASAALAPTPTMVAGPIYGGVPNYPSPVVRAQPISNVPATRQPQMTGDVFNAASKMLQALGIAPPSVSAFYAASKRALSALASLAKRTPAGTLVSLLIGLGLAANEAGVLTGWWATKSLRRRRMNPGNAKALRRAARRIKSFHRLCIHTDVLKSRGRSRGRRCGTCHSSPCRC